jgi:hypothetical protein
MNPWQAEQLVPSRRRDLERSAQTHSAPLVSDMQPLLVIPPRRHRPAMARQVGLLLIAVGRRLTETEQSPAFDTGHRH